VTDAVTPLDHAESRLAPLERAALTASWQLACAATAENQSASEQASLALHTVLADPALDADAATAAGTAETPVDRRRAEQLRLWTAANRRPRELIERIVALETEVASLHSRHRADLDGAPASANDIDEILRSSTDVGVRRAAWEASKSIGAAVDGRLRELAHLRNDAARRSGYRDHYALALALDELDEGWLYATLDRLDSELHVSHQAEKAAIDRDVRNRLGLARDEPLAPWHYSDPFFQEAPSPAYDPLADDAAPGIDIVGAARAYFNDLGDDVGAILERSDLYPRDGKDEHAFQTTLDRGDDIRVLCNVAPSLRSLETMLHELGHAVYDASIEPTLPWLLRRIAHVLTTEAVAMLHGRRARDPVFLTRYAGIAPEVAEAPLNGAITRRGLHVFVAWVQVMARFERAFYADPDRDLATHWWDLVERYQQVARPAGPRPHDWAAKVHLANAPVYYHNYLLGEVAASQLEAMLTAETGAASPAAAPRAAGALLRERFTRHGARLRWDDLVEQATGEPLTTRHLADLLTSS